MNKKIKEAEKDKVPFLLIAGDREVAERTLTIRTRGTKEQTTVGVDEFVERALGLIVSRALTLE